MTNTPKKLRVNDLLEQVELKKPLEEILEYLSNLYQIGKLRRITPLLVGHEEFNCKFTTTTGRYVVKFLNKRKSREVAEANIVAMQEFQKNDIPVPKMIRNQDNNYLLSMPEEVGSGYLFVMEYFDGKTFNEVDTTKTDISKLSKILAKLNNLNFHTNPEFDEWLLVYFPDEFNKKKKYLEREDRHLLKPILDKYLELDLQSFNKGIVHYDLHRDNVKKNANEEYAIFDLATIDHGYIAFDLATFLGLFVMNYNKDWKYNNEVINLSIQEYQKIRKLESYELKSLPVLILSIQAANVLAANFLMKSGEDNTTETEKWYILGKELVTKFSDKILSKRF
jgi:Ser/Thr protein kinase RdoA (MazF antagonist)